MKTILRRLTQAALLVAFGAGVYFALPVVARLAGGPGAAPAIDQPLQTVEVEGATGDATGNVVLQQCLVALDRWGSIAVDVLQSGDIAGHRVETSGAYLQLGRGAERRFSLLLQGRIGPATSRIWQVSDGRFLYTDLAWGDGASGASKPGRRSVDRVDLVKIRKRLVGSATGEPSPAPGAAQAELFQPGFAAGIGGAPMLLGALGENFDFGPPRQMILRNEPAYAMIGHWKPDRRDALLMPKKSPDDAEQPGPIEPPERVPHHVLLVVGAADRFPRLIEYRSGADPLAAADLGDAGRFAESQSPLLRIDFLGPRFDQPIDESRFVYRLPEGVDFRDRTADRLAAIQRQNDLARLARATPPPGRELR